MYNVLVVDDEIEIADHMYELISSIVDRDVSAYRAYSGHEAVRILTDIRMDMVVSDARMPGMSGLDLLDTINDRWPYCAFVFLTGYREFDSIYRATKHGAARYLLKTMTDEEILGEIDQTLADIEKQRVDATSLEKASERLSMMRPIAIDHAFNGLLGTLDTEAVADHIDLLTELGSPINPLLPVHLLVARVDVWFSVGDREMEQNHRAITIACEQHLGFRFHYHTMVVGDTYLATVLQARDESGEDVRSLVVGNLDVIQLSFEQRTNRAIALIVSEAAVELSRIGPVFRKLVAEINERVGSGEDMLVVSRGLSDDQAEDAARLDHDVELMVVDLETGRRARFSERLDSVARAGEAGPDARRLRELYYSVALVLYKHINRTGLFGRVSTELEIHSILQMEQHESWSSACDHLRRVADAVFDLRESEGQDRARQVIQLVRHEIESRLDADLSLVRLADLANLNPAYLSRLFKRETGHNLSAYIADCRVARARQLLRDPSIRIKEVGEQIGYTTAAYFTRFFKIKTGMSPQQYRNSLVELDNRQEK